MTFLSCDWLMNSVHPVSQQRFATAVLHDGGVAVIGIVLVMRGGNFLEDDAVLGRKTMLHPAVDQDEIALLVGFFLAVQRDADVSIDNVKCLLLLLVRMF